MPAAKGVQPAARPRSAAVVSAPPGIVGDLEVFVPELGRGGRRPVQVGEHLAVDHPLVVEYPQHFQPSGEPVDCWPVSVLSAEAVARQRVEQQRLASRPGRLVQPICGRCGAAAEAVFTDDQPSQLGIINALAGVDDTADDAWHQRARIEQTFTNAVTEWRRQQAKLAAVEGQFRSTHLTCPPDTPVVEQPQVPDTVPLQWRLPGVRTLG